MQVPKCMGPEKRPLIQSSAWTGRKHLLQFPLQCWWMQCPVSNFISVFHKFINFCSVATSKPKLHIELGFVNHM